MRALLVFALFTIVGVGLSAFGDNHRNAATDRSASYQADVYYFGGTYRRLLVETHEACDQFCANDARCLAWSHIPKHEDTAAICELKRSGGIPEAQPRTMSGRSARHEDIFADPPLHDLPKTTDTTLLFTTELAGGPGS